MRKLFFLFTYCVLIAIKGSTQTSTKPAISNYVYHPPSADKPSWQRLNLWLSSAFYRGMNLSKFDQDSSIIYVSRSLGLSRLAYAAEGIDNPELLGRSQWFDRREPAKAIQLLSKAKGKERVELLVLLGAYYTFQPGCYRYKDSIEYYLNKAINESKSINEGRLGRVALSLLGKMYVQGADTTNGKAIFGKLIDECRAAGDKRTEARAFALRALYTAYVPGSLETRIGYYKKAAEIYQELRNTEDEICVTTNMALMYLAISQLDSAYNNFEKAYQLEKLIGYPYTHYSTDHLLMVGMFQGKFGEPLKYAFETIKSAEDARDSIGWPYFYVQLGELYTMEDGRENESLKWMLKSLDRRLLDSTSIGVTLFNIVSILNKNSGREKEALDLAQRITKQFPARNAREQFEYDLTFTIANIGLKEYDLAWKHLAKADSIQRSSPAIVLAGSYERENINYLQAKLYFLEGQYEKAKKMMEEHLAGSSRIAVLTDDLEILKRLIHIDSVLKDPASAVKHYTLYAQLLDSNFRVSKTRQAEELQVVYQTQEKENQIASLHQQSKLEQANLKQANLVKNLSIAGIVAVFIITVLLYRQSRLRKKNNEVITHKNELLEHLLTEKEWLLKEIHHRVKNNLQTVMSLLNSQSAYIENDAALTAIHDSQHRVHAMSLIHQKLYNTENVSSIDMSSYIHELVSYLRDSFDTGQRIGFEYNIEPLELDVNQAVPLGLILNEAITNSIKYAFPGNRNGIVSVSLSNTAPDHYLLSISDNGVGMPSHFITKKKGSLGMSLMKGLSEDIDGNFSIENNNGTTIKVSFVYDLGIRKPGTFVSTFVTNN